MNAGCSMTRFSVFFCGVPTATPVSADGLPALLRVQPATISNMQPRHKYLLMGYLRSQRFGRAMADGAVRVELFFRNFHLARPDDLPAIRPVACVISQLEDGAFAAIPLGQPAYLLHDSVRHSLRHLALNI